MWGAAFLIIGCWILFRLECQTFCVWYYLGGNCDWEFCVHAHLYMCHFFVIVSDIFVFVVCVCVCVYTFIVTAGHVFIYNYM